LAPEFVEGVSEMARTITEDLSEGVKPGLSVFDMDASRIGYVDAADPDRGWLRVNTDPLDQKPLWIPYRLVTNVDKRELFVSVTKEDLRKEYSQPPARSTAVTTRGGRTIATTTEPSGYDGSAVEVAIVDVDDVKERIFCGYHIRTSDRRELGITKHYDPMIGFLQVRRGLLPGRDLLLPVTLVAEVDKDAGNVTLVVSEADIRRMQHPEPVDVVILQSGGQL
jgi:hypothetical protein